jgi:hypothetical protein
VLSSIPAFPPLWINELQAENLTGITNSAGQRAPWIEIYNPGASIVPLSGLYLANNYTNLTNWAFPAGAFINPGEFKVIFADGQTSLSTLSELHTSFALTGGAGALALSRIYNGQPQVLDYVNYTNLVANHSYGSYPDGQSFIRQSFFYPTPGATNDGTSAPLTISINEWMADNTMTIFNPIGGQPDDWFELFNHGTSAVDLVGYYLTDNLTNETKFLIPSGYVVPPGGFLLVWADDEDPTGSGDLHVNFKLSKAGSDIGLFGADGRPVDFVTFGAQTNDVSEGRFPDAAAGVFSMITPTPGTNNIGPNTTPILAAIPDRVLAVGQTLSFIASATDSDLPPQILTFSLAAGAPASASINGNTGQFTWVPTSGPSTNTITIVVTDNGSPSLSDSQSFIVIVTLLPVLNDAGISDGQFTFSWQTTNGQRYQVEYKDDLNVPGWNPAGSVVIGTGGPATFMDDLSAAQRFFRVTLAP